MKSRTHNRRLLPSKPCTGGASAATPQATPLAIKSRVEGEQRKSGGSSNRASGGLKLLGYGGEPREEKPLYARLGKGSGGGGDAWERRYSETPGGERQADWTEMESVEQ